MKNKINRLVVGMIAALLLLCSCEEYKPAVTNPGGNRPEESVTSPETDENGEPAGYTFTATVTDENGNPYVPVAEQPVTVKWTDGYSVYEAALDATGKATVEGLDGDYTLTLGNVPEGYAYNPNIYAATNDSRDVEIRLHKLIPTTGRGEQKYQSIEIEEPGVYCVELTSEKQEIFYEFSPKVNGQYVVESWADVTADVVNPIAKYYGANVSYKEYRFTQDDGGVSGAYTRNFLLDFAIANENISANGAAAFTFGVMAGQKAGEYPVKVYFQVRRKDDYSLNQPKSDLIVPKEPFVQQPDYPNHTFVGAESDVVAFGNRKIFDGSQYKLWPTSEGGDGYYHVYDATTNTYGPILYAKISAACRFIENPFTTIEYAGNKALTLSDGTENYKLFIEGFDYLNMETLSQNPQSGKPPYFCTLECPCRIDKTNDSVKILGVVGACFDDCDNEYCAEHCRRLPADQPEMMGMKGCGELTNSDGCYAVTEEIKQFLQKFSISQRLFNDGNGFVETHETIQVYAGDADQWLFACGYYVPN